MPLFVIPAAVTVVLAIGLLGSWWSRSSSSAYWSEDKAMSNVAEANESGSGYPDFEGKTLSYNYEGFGSFKLAIFDNHLKWQGFGDSGHFVGITVQVDLQISKVDQDEIYFLSWPTPSGGDNVVLNLKDGKVFAHLFTQPSSDSSSEEECGMDQIHGDILKYPSIIPQGLFPHGPPTSSIMMGLKMMANAKKDSLPSLDEYQHPLVAAHYEARDELTGKKLEFETDYGETILIEVKGDSTIVTTTKNNGVPASKSFKTTVTKVGSGFYFISWLADKVSGKHIVVDTNSFKVFDHTMPNSTDRKERVYKLTTFE